MSAESFLLPDTVAGAVSTFSLHSNPMSGFLETEINSTSGHEKSSILYNFCLIYRHTDIYVHTDIYDIYIQIYIKVSVFIYTIMTSICDP